MAVMADFARLPTQRKVLVFVVIGGLLGALYFQFVFKGLKQGVEDAEGEHQAKLMKNKSLEGDIPKFEALKAHMNVLRRVIDENQKALPTESELPAFFETLNRKVTEAGVEVDKWRQIAETPVESFVKVPVEIELTGTFMQIKKFFASLVPKKKRPGQDTPGTHGDQVEERERIVSIENLSLTQPTAKNRELILKAKFTAATYRQEDHAADAPATTPTTPTAPSKPPATVPTKPADKPLPPADTPAGAKARAEKAMEKDETRTRKAPEVQEPAGSGRLKGGL